MYYQGFPPYCGKQLVLAGDLNEKGPPTIAVLHMDVLGFTKNIHFWASFENFKNHQVEQKKYIFGKKIYCPILSWKNYIAQKNDWEIIT